MEDDRSLSLWAQVRRAPSLTSGIFRSNRVSRAKLLALAVLALGLGVLSLAPPWGMQAQSRGPFLKLWPAFTMTYTVYAIDTTTRQVVQNQTDMVNVKSEYDWSYRVVADRVKPSEGGSWKTFRHGILSVYTADYYDGAAHLGSGPLPDPGAITSIAPDLNPERYVDMREGKHGQAGWSDGQPLTSPALTRVAPRRLAMLRTMQGPCTDTPPRTALDATVLCPPGATSVTVTERMEYDAASINSSPTAGRVQPIGGIPVYYEKRINGLLVYRFQVDSLVIHSGVGAVSGTAAAPPPAATSQSRP